MTPVAELMRADWARLSDPAQLFLTFWSLAARWEPGDRAVLPDVTLDTRRRLREAVTSPSGPAAVAEVLEILSESWPRNDTDLDRKIAGGLMLAAMRAIDLAFAAPHPRTRTIPAALGTGPKTPAWIDAAHVRRLRLGSYAEIEKQRLIPNGPFARHARGRDAAAAESLRDAFAYLTVAPTVARQEDRDIAVNMAVIGTDIMRGVPASASIGRERVRFIPLAEAKGDLVFKPDERNGRPTLDVQPAVDTAARLIAALADGSDIDLAFAPELTVPGAAEADVQRGIAALAEHAPRIILAGSGLSVATGPCGRHWNEARVIARGGRVLWRQRKMWPFGMQQGRAVQYGFPDPGDQMLMEDVASDSALSVVDLDGFGRCVVLICQDFQSRPVVDEVVARYQPDWVLIPVLDPGVKVPGWAHTRALGLSQLSQARHLVGSSLSMAHLGTSVGAEPAVGLAIGPAEPHPAGGEPSRAVALVAAASGPTPRSGVLVWDHHPSCWGKTNIDHS